MYRSIDEDMSTQNDRNGQSSNQNRDLIRLCASGSEEELMNHFRDLPAIGGENTDATDDQQPGDADEFGRSGCWLVIKWSNILVSFICYILMILYATLEGNIWSLLYPIFVFLWALLTSGRWNIAYWIVATVYTLILMIIRFVFIRQKKVNCKDPFYWLRLFDSENSSKWRDFISALLVILSFLLLLQLIILLVCKCKSKRQPRNCEYFLIEEHQPGSQQRAENQGSKTRNGLLQLVYKIMWPAKSPLDVYWLAFIFDAVLFLMLIVFPIVLHDEHIFKYISEKYISWQYCGICLFYFTLIVLERCMYIMRWNSPKFGIHVILVLLLHGGFFFGLPRWHRKRFNESPALQVWYFIRCVAFALSAYQAKNGYPRHESHLLTKKYDEISHLRFLAEAMSESIIPYMMMIRTCLDWICTKTCLSRQQWLQLEDIYASLYNVKCDKLNNKVETSPIRKRDKCMKFVCLVVLVVIVWGPMFAFTGMSAFKNKPNPPTEATLRVSVGGYQPLFETTATGRSILPISETKLQDLRNSFGKNTAAGRFLKGKKAKDISEITFDGVSLSTWGINTYSLGQLHKDLVAIVNGNFKGDFEFVVEVRFERHTDDQHHRDLMWKSPKNLTNLRLPDVREAVNNLEKNVDPASDSKTPSKTVTIRHAFPRFLRLGRFAEVQPVQDLLKGPNGIGYSNLSLLYHKDNNNNQYASWWELQENLTGPSVFHYEPNGDISIALSVSFITFNDRIYTVPVLSGLKFYGLTALYILVIWTVGTKIKDKFFTENHTTLMFRGLDNVDPLLHLVETLYNMIKGEENLDEQRRLYQLLISLYADPVRMREFTKCPEN